MPLRGLFDDPDQDITEFSRDISAMDWGNARPNLASPADVGAGVKARLGAPQPQGASFADAIGAIGRMLGATGAGLQGRGDLAQSILDQPERLKIEQRELELRQEAMIANQIKGFFDFAKESDADDETLTKLMRGYVKSLPALRERFGDMAESATFRRKTGEIEVERDFGEGELIDPVSRKPVPKGAYLVKGQMRNGQFVPTKIGPSTKEKQTPFAKVDPKDYTPESLAEFKKTGDHTVLVSREKTEQATNMEDRLAQSMGYPSFEKAPVGVKSGIMAQAKEERIAERRASRPQPGEFAAAAEVVRREAEQNAPLDLKATRWVNPKTLEPASPDMSPREAKAAGFAVIGSNLSQAVPSARAALKTLKRYEELSEKLLVPGGKGTAGDIARITANRARLKALEAAGDPDVREFLALGSTIVQHVKAFGDTGNIAVKESEFQLTAMPSFSDSRESALRKVSSREKLLKTVVTSALSSSTKQEAQPTQPVTGGGGWSIRPR